MREIKFRKTGEDGKIEFFRLNREQTGGAVEQYTGLKDRNGVEIYEGDIVNITAIVNTDDSDMACIIDTNSIVCWDEEHARWDVNDKPEDEDWDYRRRRYFVFVDSEDRENVEVIGNVHENAELLGDEDD